MAHKRFTDDEREAIAQAIRDKPEGTSASALARQLGVSKTTVTTIAKENGLDDAFDRSKTANATAAKQHDNRARRAALVQAYLDDAEKIRERLWQPAEAINPIGGLLEFRLPPGRDTRDLVMAGTSLVKATIEVEKHDQGDAGAEAARSVLEAAASGLHAVYAAIKAEEKAAAQVGDPVETDPSDGS